MGEAYFLSRGELLSWINGTLELRLGKVEETANGAVVCQLLDALYPGVVPMKKVDFNARSEYDMINNYKVMQEVFTKLGVDKHVDVAKLIKGRPLDNIEFLQWAKAYWDQQTGGQPIDDYDPVGRRQQCKTGGVKGGGGARAGAGSAGALASRRATATQAAKTPPPAAALGGQRSRRSLIAAAGDAELAERLQEEVATWRAASEAATKEKEFYFSKLRSIELLCNTPGVSGNPVAKAVEDILYAATTEEGEQLLAAAIAELEVKDGAAAPELQQGGDLLVGHPAPEEQQPQEQPQAEEEAGSGFQGAAAEGAGAPAEVAAC